MLGGSFKYVQLGPPLAEKGTIYSVIFHSITSIFERYVSSVALRLFLKEVGLLV